MIPADNKELVLHALQEVFNAKNLVSFVTAYSTDCQGNSPDGAFKGHEGFRRFLEKYCNAFPDCKFDVQYVLAEHDRVVVHYLFEGTNMGPFAGVPPTGCVVQIPGIVVSRLADKQIVEQCFIWDNLAPRRQVSLALVASRRMRDAQLSPIPATIAQERL